MKNVRIILGILVLGIILASCGWKLPGRGEVSSPSSSEEEEAEPVEEDPNFPVTVAGVTIEKKPKRIVALNPSVVEVLYDMGLDAPLAGIGETCHYPEEAGDLIACGSEILPDTEKILELEPEWVLSLNPLPESASTVLETEGIQTICLQKPEEIEGLWDYYRDLACVVLGAEDGAKCAEDFAKPLMEAYQQIQRAGAAVEARPLGAYMAILPLTMATGDSLQGELISLCGIDNAAQEYTNWQYPEELLLPFNPEVLVLDSRTVTSQAVVSHFNYQTTPCVTENRLLEVDGSAIENGGKRLFQTMLDMVHLADPGTDLPDSLDAFEGAGDTQEADPLESNPLENEPLEGNSAEAEG